MKRLALLLFALAACGGRDATAPPALPVVYDRFATVKWEYHYTNTTTGRTEGLDSVSAPLIVALAQPPADSAQAYAERDVIGYFWAAVGADTARGAQRIWPAGGISRGRYVRTDSVVRLIAMQPPTFLGHPSAVIQVPHVDTLVYVLALADADETLAIILHFARVP